MIYCFIDSIGAVFSGDLHDLKAELQRAMQEVVGRPGLHLQIAELIGSTAQKKDARSQMRRVIRTAGGAAAATAFYDTSTSHAVLWDAILKSTENEEAKKEFLKKRAAVSVVNIDQRFEVDISAIELKYRSYFDLDQVKAMLDEGLSDIDEQCETQLLFDEEINDSPVKMDTAELTRRIKKTGRQEDRVAILLSAILADEAAKYILFNEYKKDRSQFANWAIERLRAELFLSKDNRLSDVSIGSSEVEKIIVGFLPQMYNKVFYMNRGYFLLALCKHLHQNAPIRSYVKDVIKKSNSSEIAWYAERIEKDFGPL